MNETQITQAARAFQESRTIAGRVLNYSQELAKGYARRYGVLQYVYATPQGYAIDTARPQVGPAWRVAPSGSVTYVNSGE